MSKLVGDGFPSPTSIPLKDALHWATDADWVYEVKEDGVRAELAGGLFGRACAYELPSPLPASLDNCRLDGEFVSGRVFMAFDVKIVHGQDVTGEPRWFRREVVEDLVRRAQLPCLHVVKQHKGHGGRFLEDVIRAGGEGVVAKHEHAPYGVGWYKAKNEITEDCIITEVHGSKNSVRLGQLTASGEMVDRGWCAAWGRAAENYRSGQVVEVTYRKIHVSGRFCEARITRCRLDKPTTECLLWE